MSKPLLSNGKFLFLISIFLYTFYTAIFVAPHLFAEKPFPPKSSPSEIRASESSSKKVDSTPILSVDTKQIITPGASKTGDIDKYKMPSIIQYDIKMSSIKTPLQGKTSIGSEKIPLGDFGGEMRISRGKYEATITPASIRLLKAWGYQPKTAELFATPVKVSVSKLVSKKKPLIIRIEAESNQIFITKEIFFSIYDILKEKKDKDTLSIITDSLHMAGPEWDFCIYNWGDKYIGYTFFKEAGNIQEPIEIKNLSLPETFYPLAKEKFNRALVAAWWLEISSTAEKKDAIVLKGLADQVLEAYGQ